MAARTGGEVLRLDLPGVGTERDRPAPTSIAETVADLRARFLASRGPGPWGLFAPSLGGMIALHWAEFYPEDFARVAVCNTSAKDLAGLFERFSFEALGTVAKSLWAGEGEARQAHILALVSNTVHGQSHAAAFASFAQDAPIGPAVMSRQLFAASKARAPARLELPLLVLCSEADRLCAPKASRVLAERLGAPLRVHPTAGHDLPLDDPDWVIDQLADWA